MSKKGSQAFTFKPELIAHGRSRDGYNDQKYFPSQRELSEIANVSRITFSRYTKQIVEMLLKQEEDEEKANFLKWCDVESN